MTQQANHLQPALATAAESASVHMVPVNVSRVLLVPEHSILIIEANYMKGFKA
jgi:hypothetical protein